MLACISLFPCPWSAHNQARQYHYDQGYIVLPRQTLISDGSGVGNSSAWAFFGVIPCSSWDSEYGNLTRFFFVFARTRRPSSVTSMITLSPRPKRDILLTGLVIRIPRLLPQGWIVLSNRAFAIALIITPLSQCSYVTSIYQVVTMSSPNKLPKCDRDLILYLRRNLHLSL